MRMSMRVVVAAALVGIGSQAFLAQAGWRHFRMYGSNCAGPACSAPLYVAAPPTPCACGPAWGCATPAYGYPQSYQAPMTYQAQMPYQPAMPYQAGYAPTTYGGLPMTAYGSGYGQPSYGTYYDFSTAGAGSAMAGGYGGSGANGFGTGGMYGTPISYPQSPNFGGFGYGVGYGGMNYGGLGYGGMSYGAGYQNQVPSYYAPVPSQYTPVPPAPASDLVW